MLNKNKENENYSLPFGRRPNRNTVTNYSYVSSSSTSFTTLNAAKKKYFLKINKMNNIERGRNTCFILIFHFYLPFIFLDIIIK